MQKINEIIDLLVNSGLIVNNNLELKRLKKGTTNGDLYTLLIKKIPTYVIKVDSSKIIIPTHDFLLAYQDVKLLPDVLYTDDKNEFIVYSYIPGETHYNRGPKLEWMTILIKELFNKYQRLDKGIPWGRVNGIQRKSWSDFNHASSESARENIGDFLPNEDHKRVEILVKKLNFYHSYEDKYYLHGDTGVHNFVYSDNKLNGVIDPSP
ncbi:hypothetical protein [Bacillus sp. FJAT-27225]|uniref:hypothetical protein n=1 Tax=Bacillus sp. FJAT-27225 TaxID=1743144 RepID=UPI000981CEA7|nr:hypothetical protein [Bacillus sp. FJAT-27225]